MVRSLSSAPPLFVGCWVVVVHFLYLRSSGGFFSSIEAFTVVLQPTATTRAAAATRTIGRRTSPCWLSSSPEKEQENQEDDVQPSRTTFDQAGASLIDEEDKKRMEEMGEFDSNPNSDADSIEKMRSAIRARTSDLGLEKSKVSAEYVQRKQQEAMAAGSARAAAESSDIFGGIDLSQIRSEATPRASSNSVWADEEGEVPSMFYEPEDDLSEEEQAEADPIGQKSIPEQVVAELQNAKWPSPWSALREVAVMVIVVAVTTTLIIGWDKVLREFYTDTLNFIPSKEDMANYANRFEGLDLPTGWTDNMNEDDIASFTDTVGSVSRSASSSSGMPDL